ncbi:uncharacterized protein Nmag_2824 [Natrialba magadii ATCC 43099]|uniref:Uncharacterized protein n=1 Tax=Natrialba magadii (strain ATCC 43099 / DSM 3394 / CCM 3739 / CIP 104546 / IAM 13178 / JCM 8861 / NBRC 102185 / NCIMB 2190 / MS3) TaxID=547559 RepID=D3SZW8_NATMM|nr:hypothetical protein [Natrialba magadii]ADD06378.1 uncharacterized protein Nmag_2824 [Natrialba magadii ATCC 43099]ELY31479.1 hypothetical protein C500_06286 [Natrialba magadii ATCC 43099]
MLVTLAVVTEVTTPTSGFGALSNTLQSLSMYAVALALTAGLPPGFVVLRRVIDAARSGTELALRPGTFVLLCLECCALASAAVSYPIVVIFAEFWGPGFRPASIALTLGLESVAGVTGHEAVALFLLAVVCWAVAWLVAAVRGEA